MNMEQLFNDIPAALKGAEIGLPDEVFSFVSSVTPMVNVDLLIIDEAKGTLLSWRKDDISEGWHIPGGIVRFKETLEERIHRTAQKELGTDVSFDETPLKISEIFMPYQRRGHFISFLYRCRLPKGYSVERQEKRSGENGYLAWHNTIPRLVPGQSVYEEFLRVLKKNKTGGAQSGMSLLRGEVA